MSHYKQIDKATNLTSKVFEGCFLGGRPEQAVWRDTFRKELFNFANGIKVHCDTDFGLATPKVVDKFIRVLSKNGGYGMKPVPTHVSLKSHESEPIQVADIIAGVCGWNYRKTEFPPSPFSPIWFNDKYLSRIFQRRKKEKSVKLVKAYYWRSQN